MVQYFDKLQSRMHVLGPSADVAGMEPIGIELAEVLRGLRLAARKCPAAAQLWPGGQVCRGLLARLCEIAADMNDSLFAKSIAQVAGLDWLPGANLSPT